MKPKKPSCIQLPNNVKFYPVVLQVVEKDEDGSPRMMRLLKDTESVKIEGGEEFWIVYGPDELRRMAKEWN